MNNSIVIDLRVYRLVCFLLCFSLCQSITAQKSNNSKPIRFLSEGCTVERPAYHTFAIVKHSIPYKIKLDPSYADKWVSWEIKKDTVYIDIKEYENGSVRDCKLVAYSNDGKHKDFYTIKEEIKNRLVDRCTKPIYFPSNGISLGIESFHRNIYIRSTIPYTVRLEPSSANKWVKYKIKGDSIEIDVMGNHSSEGRSCEIIAFSKDKKYRASYKVNQKGTSSSYSTLQSSVKNIRVENDNSNKKNSSRNTFNSSTTSVQCHGRTKSGARCSRRVSDGIYCWQHR